ncbi:UNVERIFIED_CONTAM: hypothetical protein HDU68_011414, partial [Siphonaria sp. JEL0065]
DYLKQAGEIVKTVKDETVEKAHKEFDGLFKDLIIPAVVSDAVLAAFKEVFTEYVGKSQAQMEKADKVKARNKQKRAFKKRLSASWIKRLVGIFSIVADSENGKGSAADVAALKSKGGKKAVKANVLGTIGKKEAKGKQSTMCSNRKID